MKFDFESVAKNASEYPGEASSNKRPRRKVAEMSTPEKAQLLWDSYQDLKTVWRAFLIQKKESTGDQNTVLKHLAHLTDANDDLAKEFKASSLAQKLLKQVKDLYSEPEVQVTFKSNQENYRKQWDGVNGKWKEFSALREEIKELEAEYDDLERERFDERGKPEVQKRRTLKYDIANSKKSLEAAREAEKTLLSENRELSLRVLSETLDERRSELRQGDGFMWFPSRRLILEKLEDKIAEARTLRVITLEGESGTGKTSFADAAAVKLTREHLVASPVARADMKVDRALFADEKIAPEGSRTAYQEVLRAITGKVGPEKPIQHSGRVAFLDELNRLTNDQASAFLTALDSMKVGGETRYALNDADPKDKVQGRALVLAAQNPAGETFPDRTVFSPEVERKQQKVQVSYFNQTPEDPELYEALLVSMMDADGRILAAKSDLAPAFTDPEISPDGKTKQSKLKIEDASGGALWRFSNFLHEIYENFYRRPNLLTKSNPDAWLKRHVLTPGDAIEWLTKYTEILEERENLQNYLSNRLREWIEEKMRGNADVEEKRLYLELAQKFVFLTPSGDTVTDSNSATQSIMTKREIAEMSPRIPRAIEGLVEAPKNDEQENRIMNLEMIDGTKLNRVSFRFSATKVLQNGFEGPGGKELRFIGHIVTCGDKPELKGMVLLEEIGRPERKIVATSKQANKMFELFSNKKVERKEATDEIEARKIFGKDFLGRQEVKALFDVDVPETKIPYSAVELKEAQKEGMMLVYRIDKDAKGKKLDMTAIDAMALARCGTKGQKAFIPPNDGSRNELFFTDSPRAGWKLVSKELLGMKDGKPIGKVEDQSMNKDYLAETKVLIKYAVKHKLLNAQELTECSDAELDKVARTIFSGKTMQELVDSQNDVEWKFAAEFLSSLKVNEKLRRTPAEVLYDMVLHLHANGDRLLSGVYDRANRRNSSGSLAYLGDFDASGLGVSWHRPDGARPNIGVCVSRNVSHFNKRDRSKTTSFSKNQQILSRINGSSIPRIRCPGFEEDVIGYVYFRVLKRSHEQAFTACLFLVPGF
ncbi:MAG: AAA family ATPase [bacterium]